ncbi:hypothetical protein [Legionella sp.]|uniref:hypothetical protein n=1 Tax=Legionella sp. TaxID=459 RepID=UPI000CC723E0|nr:hypothetical protein [Legionella sp.]PJE15592.1 MAG: hypothetical protein CK430_04105 [Legionella sp.]
MALRRGFSFDWDGSTAPGGCDDIFAVPENILLIKGIKDSNPRYKETHVFINSNRQSVRDDNANSGANKNGSCYPRIQELSKEIGATFHPLLLTDIYNDLEDGETFKQALTLLDQSQKDYVQERVRATNPPDWLHDSSKLSILLAQVHLMASEHPEDKFHFYFLDDRKDILDGLAAFFAIKENRKLLPYNLEEFYLIPHPSIRKEPDNSLQNKADGLEDKEKESEFLTVIENESPPSLTDKKEEQDDYISYAPIAGEGEIRFDYRQMIKTMAAVCIESKKFQESDPTDQDANQVRNYEQAKRGGFTLTSTMNFVRDYVFGKEPKSLPEPTEKFKRLAPASLPLPAASSPTAVSPKKGILNSIFHPLHRKEKEKDKGKEKEQEKGKGKDRRKEKNKKEKHEARDKKETGNLQNRLNRDLKNRFVEKEKKQAAQSVNPGIGSKEVTQGPIAPVPNGSFFSGSRARHPDAPPTSSTTLSNHRGGTN